MNSLPIMHETLTRRAFVRCAGCSGAAAWFATHGLALAAQTGRESNTRWRNQIGLQLSTIRPALANRETLEAAFAKISALGIREVETTLNYDFAGLSPKEFRALLDRYRLTMPVTHAVAVEGPDLEKTLEGFQIMGLKYARIGAGGTAGAVARVRGEDTIPPPDAAKKRDEKREAAALPQSVEAAKRGADQNNRRGRLLRKFGLKNYVHNHTIEFELLDDGKSTRHEITVTETDPELVTIQLDIGWASVAGQNVTELFRRHPGRYELWHVKDATGLKTMDRSLTPTQRQRIATLCPVGEGDVDFRSIFVQAGLAGLKHFAIEQDNAPRTGDPMTAVQTSFRNLMTKILA